jgi:two-component system cell cycle sensor histidine kinase/response regulator CckA
MNTARIMVVEDERITAESIKCTLEDLGYAVCAIVATGAEAVAQAEEQRPDLVLMDIVLRGGMDGIDAAERIRAAHNIPIVYATAYADEPFLRRARVTAPYGYILKPFTTRELHSNIEMALHKSQLDRRIARQNAVLDTIRKVNQLTLRERVRDRLLRRVCELLVERGGYTFAWAVLFDQADKLLHTARAGLSEAQFQPMEALLRAGRHPSCFQKVLGQPGGVLIRLRAVDCPDCPLRNEYPGSQSLAVCVGRGGHTPGLLFAGAAAVTAVDETERTLFGELAEDISVALHAINVEAERSQTEQALRHAQKLEAVGQLAAGVAHDFNNLLTAILGHADLASEALPPDHPARESLRGIEVAVRHATGVTRGLLTFSGRSVAQKETIYLPSLVRESTRLLRHLLPAAIELQTDAPLEPALTLHADPTQLQQVLMNLAVNARDAMPTGGCLRIALSGVGAPDVSAAASETAVATMTACLTVSDTGVGMTPEVQARIFEPFFTTKSRGQGTGLGLAIIHSIVREHGGRIEVESAPGAGSTFRVLLPATISPVVADSTAADMPPPRGHGERILLAEDDRYIRETIATSLKVSGYTVTQVADGAEFWTCYLECRGAWRTVVLDVDLPKRDGPDCLEAIRAGGDHVPAILITARSDFRFAGLEAEDVLLRKPFHVSALVRLVAQAIERKQPKEGAK